MANTIIASDRAANSNNTDGTFRYRFIARQTKGLWVLNVITNNPTNWMKMNEDGFINV